MNKGMKILFLKRQARKSYEKFYALLDQHDCGAALLKEISGDASMYARQFNEAMSELEGIDEGFVAQWSRL